MQKPFLGCSISECKKESIFLFIHYRDDELTIYNNLYRSIKTGASFGRMSRTITIHCITDIVREPEKIFDFSKIGAVLNKLRQETFLNNIYAFRYVSELNFCFVHVTNERFKELKSLDTNKFMVYNFYDIKYFLNRHSVIENNKSSILGDIRQPYGLLRCIMSKENEEYFLAETESLILHIGSRELVEKYGCKKEVCVLSNIIGVVNGY